MMPIWVSMHWLPVTLKPVDYTVGEYEKVLESYKKMKGI
jgi:hypothetical protein